MKTKKFSSFEEAVNYCKERGKLQFFGKEGKDFEYCIYTLTIGRKVFHLRISDSGVLDVLDETRDREFRFD